MNNFDFKLDFINPELFMRIAELIGVIIIAFLVSRVAYFFLFLSFRLIEKNYGMTLMDLFLGTVEKLKVLKEKNPNGFYIFILVFSLLNTFLVLPFYTISFLIFAYLIADFWLTVFVLTLIPTFISMVMHFTLRRC